MKKALLLIIAGLVLVTGCGAQVEGALPGAPSPSSAAATPSTQPTPSQVTTPMPQLPHPDQTLLKAATDGDAALVTRALDSGADIETRNGQQQTALLLAATNDRVAAAQVLVARGANPNALDYRHDTPWLVTGVTGSVAMLETLLPAKPDMNIENRYGGLSVIPASERGHVEYVKRVVQTGINVNHVNNLGWTALLEAVILGDGGPRHQEIVRTLLAAGADRSIKDKHGRTALQNAQAKGYTAIVRILQG